MDLAIMLTVIMAAAIAAIAVRGAALGRQKLAREKLGRFMVVAMSEAVRRRHAEVLPEHLLLTAVTDPVVAGLPAMSEVRVKATDLLDKIDAHPGASRDRPGLSRSAKAICAHAIRKAVSRGASVVSASDLLDALRNTDGPVGDLCTSSSIEGASRQQADPTGHAAYPAGFGEKRARVIIWNDPKTTFEQVLDVLERYFAISSAEAMHFALAVHHDGACAFGSYPEEEASERVAKASAYLHEKGIPLRLTVETDATPTTTPPRRSSGS